MRQPEFYLASYLLLKKGNQVLLLRRFKTGWGDGMYTLPSGHVEGTETARDTMKREAKEEVGIEIDLKDLKVVHIQQRNASDRKYVDFYLIAEKWKGEPKNNEPEKSDDVRWFDIDKIPTNTLEFITIVIKKIGNNEFYSEHGF